MLYSTNEYDGYIKIIKLNVFFLDCSLLISGGAMGPLPSRGVIIYN